MKQLSLTAAKREVVKKNASYKMKTEGRIAAVLYGPGKENMNISVSGRGVLSIINNPSMSNAIIDLAVEGEPAPRKVILKDYQTDPVKNKLLHIDFYEISMDRPMTVTVALQLAGKPVGVAEGGVLEQQLREVQIKCLPDRIPEFIEVDVSALNIGDNLALENVKVPEGIKILTDKKRTVAVITIVKEEVVETVAAVEGEAVAAEGEAAAPAAEGAAADKSAEDKKATAPKQEKAKK
ncbi:MAG TPA: 50S ribosomal protein L25 [bacterium]|nr:50S ribosomal protein L25 [bacterium]HPN30548.1 50S ribosomal protein L25 [bacterium]